MCKKIVRYLSTALILYIAYALFFYTFQRNLLFPIEYAGVPHGIANQVPDSSKIWVNTEFGSTETWYLPPLRSENMNPCPLVIIGHGNGDVIDRWINVVLKLREVGIGVLLVEYPGYGRSTGKPSQESITKSFVNSYDSIVTRPEIDKNNIILLGQSIGGGAVCALAKERPSVAIILISTFTNVGVFATNYFLPKFLVKDPFDNLSVISKFDGPILYIHGNDDKVIPYKESEKLLSASKNGKLIKLDGGHNMIIRWDPIWNKYVIPFLKEENIL